MSKRAVVIHDRVHRYLHRMREVGKRPSYVYLTPAQIQSLDDAGMLSKDRRFEGVAVQEVDS